MNNYSSKEIVQALRISLRQLQYWDEQNIVRPSIRKACGKGSNRLYSDEDFCKLQVVQKLRSKKIGLQDINKCLKYLEDHYSDINSISKRIVVINKRVYLLDI
jgi:DNA-binding transcriptional MerR regulator